MIAGVVRLLTPLEMAIATAMACTPTSASFLKIGCSKAAARRFFGAAHKPSPTPSTVVFKTPQPPRRSNAPPPEAPAHGIYMPGPQPSVDIEPLVVPSSTRKRSLEDYLSQDNNSHELPAHRHPVYGYRNQDFDLAAELSTVRAYVLKGFSERTTKVERGHWKKWLKFCRIRGLRPWRDDHDANEGRDKEGYQREVDILTSFLLYCLRTMKSNKKRPAALPQSAANVCRGLRRIHKKRSPPINMVPMAAAMPVLKALTKEYMRKYGYRMLLPRRREPWRPQHLKKMFAMRKKTSGKLILGGITVSTSVFWLAYFALSETLAQCGMRSSEALVHKSSDWHPADHLSRASLLWGLGGKPPISNPTAAQLRSLTEKDYAILIPPPSKTDAFGVIWGDKPIYLPVRFNSPYCAALRLRDLELALPLAGKQRAQVPLFCDEDCNPMLYKTAYAILNDQKKLVLTDEFDQSLFTFHSYRVYLATTLAAAGCTDSEIQALCRWQTVDSLRIYKRFQPKEVCAMLDRAQKAKVESYTAANLPTISSYQIAAGIHAWDQ